MTASFTYDALGTRTARTVDNTATGFLNTGANVASEQATTGSTAATLHSADAGRCLDRTTAGVTDAVLTDALGSRIAVISASKP